MEISIHKTGLTKNNKKWMCAKVSWVDGNGVSCNEYFFIRPWHMDSFEKVITGDTQVKEEIKAIYGTQS